MGGRWVNHVDNGIYYKVDNVPDGFGYHMVYVYKRAVHNQVRSWIYYVPTLWFRDDLSIDTEKFDRLDTKHLYRWDEESLCGYMDEAKMQLGINMYNE